jgi:hypothetical protein
MFESGPERTYEDGRHEWRRDVGGGWTKWSDSRGGQGFEKDLGNGWVQRGDRFAKDHGSHVEWGNGPWERKWDR